MSADVFVSYSSKDRDRVLALAQCLQRLGVSVWVDRNDIDPTALWQQEITTAIHGCKVFLLAASTSCFASDEVASELAMAHAKKKPRLVVYLEPAEFTTKMEYALAGIHHVELHGGAAEDALRALVRGLVRQGVAVDEA